MKVYLCKFINKQEEIRLQKGVILLSLACWWFFPTSVFLSGITLHLHKLVKSLGYEMSDWNAEGEWRHLVVWEISLRKYMYAILQPVSIHALYLQLLFLLFRNWILRGKAQVLDHQQSARDSFPLFCFLICFCRRFVIFLMERLRSLVTNLTND